MKAEYRICRDFYCGFEVQTRRWWWPFWVCIRSNTHSTVQDAEAYAIRAADNNLVKYLGRLP